MFKKLLLASLIVVIGLYGAGYDVMGAKDDIIGAANKQAEAMSPRQADERSDWGSDAM
ncbi:MAG: hypothetical protein HKP43_00720 [Altererythrobacter sp.]|uniref:hypothetical protein n=1 Tax=uncultured Altererythrobacter sp. TaxID=500840 RepID=UPI001821ABB1|nr:hypothetical protein [uncultured Altererythrobacter sp.]MBT8389355.1 hypothetical protein [Altererythrobacter sp.]MBT8432088.1 hypothetical protein [Altererythrobacter sp.]NNE49266.1 hypothetical protein [Altererythrobacter sp.]NNF93091.1 hypothetical protein [Altererythrobacter sp.]NNK45133.1 hypothetical protein [Altererythrobacter sp.]